VVYQSLGILGFILILFTAWIFRGSLSSLLPEYLPTLLGFAGGLFFFSILLPVIETMRSRELRRTWRQRLAERDDLPAPYPGWDVLDSIINPINKGLGILFRKGIGKALLALWGDAGFGSQPLSLIISILSIIAFGIFAGYSLTSRYLLSGFITFLLIIGLLALVYSRARMQRQLFQDQFPGVLDRLADSLLAGFSLPQAIEFVVPNLSQPSSSEMELITNQIKIGFTIEEALQELYQRRPSEDVRLLVEGLTLQRQVGGNMAEMMRDMANLVRERVELQNEVKTKTAQGRLSAVVIALLVPVSLGLLSMFPGYTDVLFNTTVGNLVLITAGVLELLGTALVVRLIRIEV
jgi:tight adherence protein B